MGRMLVWIPSTPGASWTTQHSCAASLLGIANSLSWAYNRNGKRRNLTLRNLGTPQTRATALRAGFPTEEDVCATGARRANTQTNNKLLGGGLMGS